MRRVATYTAVALGAAMVFVGLVTIALSLEGRGDPRPEIVTGGAALMLATGLIGGNGRNGNGRGDTRPRRRR